MLFNALSLFEDERKRPGGDLVLPAYDYCLKCFMVQSVDSRGAISVTKSRHNSRVRQLAAR